MEAKRYDAPVDTQVKVEYDQQMADLHRELVAGGFVTPGTKQKVDLALVEAFLRVREGATADSLELLTRVQKDLDAAGCAEVNLDFVLAMDQRLMEIAADEVSEEIIGDDSSPIGQAIGYVMANRLPDALAVLNRAAESGRHGAWVYWHRGRVFQQMGDLEHALKDLLRYLDAGEPCRRPTTLVWCSEILAAQGRQDEAIRFLASAVADLEAHPHPYDLDGEPDWAKPPADREESDEEQMERENEKEWWSQEYAAGQLRCIIARIDELEASAHVSADLRPALEEVKTDVVRLRTQLGF